MATLNDRSDDIRALSNQVDTSREAFEWDRAINRQYLNAGGFCGYCGEACTPFTSILPEELKDTACEYNGEHPQCTGEHKMEFEGKTPDTFGGYEIYVCVNPGCDYQEAC